MDLTKTETEIVLLIKEGLTKQEILEKMFISPHTLKTHLHHIYKKYGIKRSKENYHNSFKRLKNEICIY